ncbi:hypothetical protein KKA09_00960 [Patescibacteria group bacterium]|nr:hypothetical protein [Patescibacteria group bacterium]
MPFEIGLGDPKDMKPGYIHFDIRREIEKEIKEEIEEKTSCLLQLDEKKEINLLLDSRWYESFAPLLTTGLLKNFQEMLERYQIKKIWVFGEGENKEIFEEIEKMVWDDQISAYAKKQGMTNTEFLRLRLIGAKLGEVYESKK